MGAELVPATAEHAEQLIESLRPEDAAEIEACGVSAAEGVRTSFETSDEATTYLFDGEVAAMFGVAVVGETVLGRSGRFWFLTGRAFAKHPRQFMRAARPLLRALLERYGTLSNVVDARYAAAIRFARSFGFEVGAPRPHGPFGMPFCPFEARRSTWVG